MGNLPSVRVRPARPFLNAGVDFAGPFQALSSKGRGIRTTKAYITIFVCLSNKAIQLELVGDLSTAAFIGAFTQRNMLTYIQRSRAEFRRKSLERS